MADIFLSYSSTDKSIVQSLAEIFTAKGWSVWWDHEIPVGQRFDNVIEAELQAAKCVVVIWTQRSIASEWVKNEANFAASKGNLVPLMLEQVTLPVNFSRIEAALLFDWDGKSDHAELQNLLQSVDSIITGKKRPSGSGKVIVKKPFFRRPSTLFVVLFALIVLVSFLIFRSWPTEGNIVVKVVDWKHNPLSNGLVKIAIKEYTRAQSIDREGQALFTQVPSDGLKVKSRIEVSSPGFIVLRIDTMLSFGKPIELVLQFQTEVMIRGRVKTAAEMPLANVQVSVEGTRYFAISRTDGTFDLRLEEYTLGDEVNISAELSGFDTKIFALTLSAPEMTKQDIVLNPISP